MDSQYIVYAGATNETLLVHPKAFRIIELLENVAYSRQSLNEAMGAVDQDSKAFVEGALRQFVHLGVIERLH